METGTQEDIELLVKRVINCAYAVRNKLKAGYLETIYKNALLLELRHERIPVTTEVPFNISYRDTVIGKYRADIVVDGRLILELKAVENLSKAHEVQLVNYLTTTGIDDGLLINFGRLDGLDIKRKYRIYRPSTPFH